MISFLLKGENGCGSAVAYAAVNCNQDDQVLIKRAFIKSELRNPLLFVENGEELLDFLRGRDEHKGTLILPALILLDLNMPVMDGREVLAEIKKDPLLGKIPVTAPTTSRAEADIETCYELHANACMVKSTGMKDLVSSVEKLVHYWLDTVTLPRLKG